MPSVRWLRFADSYAYDGKRRRLWNDTNVRYGELWVPGDVIGCCIDLPNGTISFRRNGADLGIAARNLRRGDMVAFFPALSLSGGEQCAVNFGGVPFRYPVTGYQPLQPGPLPPVQAVAYLLGRPMRLRSSHCVAAYAGYNVNSDHRCNDTADWTFC